MATAALDAPGGRVRGGHQGPDGPTPSGESVLPPFATWQDHIVALLLPTASFFTSWWPIGRLPGTNINLSDILMLLCALAILLSRGLRAAMFGRMSATWVIGIAMLVGGMLIGSLAHGDIFRWPIVAGQYVFAFLLVPMLLASCPRPLLQRCAMAYILGVAVSQIIGLALVNTLDHATINEYVNPYVVTGNGRLGAMTGEPNSNGAVCTFALIFLLHASLHGRLRAGYATVLAVVLLAGLIASASFTGIAAATLSTGLVLAFSRLRTAVAIALPVALLVGVHLYAGGPVPQVFEQRVGEALVTGDPSKAGTYLGRTVLIKEAWQMADDNLVIGLGSDGYRKNSVYGMPVHQLYLLLLNEGGIVSFLGLCLMFLAMLVEALLITGRNRLDGICCLGVLAVFFIYTMSLPHMFGRMWSVPPLLLFALANAAYLGAGRSPLQRTFTSPRLAAR